MTTGIRPTASILDRIVADKLAPLAERQRQVPESSLSTQTFGPSEPLSEAIITETQSPAGSDRAR